MERGIIIELFKDRLGRVRCEGKCVKTMLMEVVARTIEGNGNVVFQESETACKPYQKCSRVNIVSENLIPMSTFITPKVILPPFPNKSKHKKLHAFN